MGNHGWWLQAIGRTKSGVSITQAQASLASATSSVLRGPNTDTAWAADASKSHFNFVAESAPGGSTFLRAFFRQPLLAVLGLCCALLLLACLNLASLLFARSAAREHELATRAAIGATRRRLLQQLLTESLLLAITGAVIGLAAAPFVAQSLATLLIGQFENSYLDTSLDWRVLLAATCGALVTAVLIGFTPALHATGRNLNLRLKGHRTATSSRAHGGFVPAILLSTQVGLALVLVIGAGLLSTSLVRLYHDGLGFDPHGLSTATLSMAKQPLQEDALTRNYRAMRDQIAALPGVKNTSVVAMVPFSGSSANNVLKGPDKKEIKIWLNVVAPEYFKTMRIPLLGGRDFAWTDAPSDSQKIVISRSAAQQLFPNEDPVGHPLEDAENKHYEVIGIVGDAKSRNAHEPLGPMAYFPITQNKDVKPSYTFIARLDGPALPFATAVRAIVARDAPDIPAPIFSTMSSTLDQSLSAERMMAMLSVFFAACALLVTAIGLYGTLAYRTARRTSEIGIRMALGAQRTQVVSLVFGQNVAVTLVGAVAGLAAALLAARALASFLYGTSTHDPLVLGGATLLLALVASIASLLPAIRAARINPLTAIRTE
jgi:predicted permease